MSTDSCAKARKRAPSLGLLIAFLGVIASASMREAQAAGKLSLFAGSYAFTLSSSGSISGVGNYSGVYSHEISTHWVAFAGATFLLSGAIRGQTGFGLDFGACYYPLTETGVMHKNIDNLDVRGWSTWRPYLGLAARQRQIQVNSQPTYLGVGGLVGLALQVSRRFSLEAEVHYDQLSGASNTSMTQTNFMLGGSVYF